MSQTRQVTIWCDDCSVWEQASLTAAKLRKELHTTGWTTIKHYSIRDYCPTCSLKRKKALEMLMDMTPQQREDYLSKQEIS